VSSDWPHFSPLESLPLALLEVILSCSSLHDLAQLAGASHCCRQAVEHVCRRRLLALLRGHQKEHVTILFDPQPGPWGVINGNSDGDGTSTSGDPGTVVTSWLQDLSFYTQALAVPRLAAGA